MNARSDEGDTPLMYAAAYSTADCMKLLLDARADPNARDRRDGTALMRSVRTSTRSGCCWTAAPKSMHGPRRGLTALMVAANHPGASDVVKLLLSHKADPELPMPLESLR